MKTPRSTPEGGLASMIATARQTVGAVKFLAAAAGAAALAACGGDSKAVEAPACGDPATNEPTVSEMEYLAANPPVESTPPDGVAGGSGDGDDDDTDDGLDAPPLPRIAVKDLGTSSLDGNHYLFGFNVPPFDEEALAEEFEANGCSMFPLGVRVRGALESDPTQLQEGESSLSEEIIGSTEVLNTGRNALEGVIPVGKTLLSYVIELFSPAAGDRNTAPTLARTVLVEATDRGPAQLDCSFEDCPEKQEGETPTAAPAEGDMQ